jgi:hypothetical protein
MFTIDQESTDYFKKRLKEDQAVRIFFGGFG